MFYVSQKTNIKRNPKGVKTDGELFWNICDFWEENQRETVPEVATRVGPRPLQAGAPPPSWATRKAVDALLWPQES